MNAEMKGWRRVQLQDVTCGNAFGPRFSSDHYSDNGNIGTIRTTDLDDEGKINYSTIPYATLPEDSLRSHFLNDGDLLITRSGTCGVPCVFESQHKPIVAGAFLIRFQLTKDVEPRFLHSLLLSQPLQKQIEAMSSGGVQKNLTGTNLLKLTFALPPLPEQQKIAAILSTWDRAIELTEKLIAAKQKRKQALMQQLLSRNGKLNQHGSFKKVKLSTVLQRVNNPIEVDPTTEYREIGIRSHGKGIFHKEAVSGKSLGDKRVYRVHPDCFVFNVVFAWEQAIAKTTSNEVGMIASHRFPMYQPVSDRIDLDFLLYFFKTSEGKDLLGLASPGGAGRNRTLSQTGFLNTLIPLPTLKQQRAIAAVLCAMDSELDLQISRCHSLKRQKKGLMQKLLTGKVRVNVAAETVKG